MTAPARQVKVTRHETGRIANGEWEIVEFEGNLMLRIVMGELDGRQVVGAELWLDDRSPAQLRQIAARAALRQMELEART